MGITDLFSDLLSSVSFVQDVHAEALADDNEDSNEGGDDNKDEEGGDDKKEGEEGENEGEGGEEGGDGEEGGEDAGGDDEEEEEEEEEEDEPVDPKPRLEEGMHYLAAAILGAELAKTPDFAQRVARLTANRMCKICPMPGFQAPLRRVC